MSETGKGLPEGEEASVRLGLTEPEPSTVSGVCSSGLRVPGRGLTGRASRCDAGPGLKDSPFS